MAGQVGIHPEREAGDQEAEQDPARQAGPDHVGRTRSPSTTLVTIADRRPPDRLVQAVEAGWPSTRASAASSVGMDVRPPSASVWMAATADAKGRIRSIGH